MRKIDIYGKGGIGKSTTAWRVPKSYWNIRWKGFIRPVVRDFL